MDLKKTLKTIKLHENQISMAIGIIILLISGIFLIIYFKNFKTQSQVTDQGASTQISDETKYTVKKGDTLWKISEKFYQKGSDWKKIADANQITNTRKLEIGKELVIPEITEGSKTQAQPQSPIPNTKNNTSPQAIVGANYIVIKGDTLWQIAIRSYQDGYKWTKIAQENHLKNPNLIHPGNNFIIPR